MANHRSMAWRRSMARNMQRRIEKYNSAENGGSNARHAANALAAGAAGSGGISAGEIERSKTASARETRSARNSIGGGSSRRRRACGAAAPGAHRARHDRGSYAVVSMTNQRVWRHGASAAAGIIKQWRIAAAKWFMAEWRESVAKSSGAKA